MTQRDGALTLKWADFERPDGKTIVVHIKRSKTKAGERALPLPSALLKVTPEFKTFEKRDRTATIASPLPPSTSMSRACTKLIRDAGIQDRKVTLHSSRQLLRDLLVEAGASGEVIVRIVGHKTAGVGAKYGSGQVEWKAAKEWLEKLPWRELMMEKTDVR